MNAGEWRAVPLEVLRGFARDQAEANSLRSAAERFGVGRSTLAHFIEGDTTPHPRIRRAVALHYLGERSIGELRDIVRERVALTSMRGVAEDVGAGVSHGTIHKFLHGALPQPRVMRALEEWAAKLDRTAAPDVQGALWLLLVLLPEEKRAEGERAILDAIADLHRKAGLSVPPWADV